VNQRGEIGKKKGSNSVEGSAERILDYSNERRKKPKCTTGNKR